MSDPNPSNWSDAKGDAIQCIALCVAAAIFFVSCAAVVRDCPPWASGAPIAPPNIKEIERRLEAIEARLPTMPIEKP